MIDSIIFRNIENVKPNPNHHEKINLLFILALLFAISCSTEKKENLIDLNIPWKFKAGDNMAWVAPAFDDSKWVTILPNKNWEDQGFEKLDGFACTA